MRVSELVVVVGMMNPHRVETQSDAIAILSNEFQVNSFVDQFGDVAVEFDKDANVWRVPEFAAAIERYNEAKTLDCQKWGSE
jgi:hypothetical protein